MGGLGRLEQFRRQIRVCLTRHQLRVVPGFRHLGEQFILLRLLQKLGGVPQAGLAAGRQDGLVSDKFRLTPGPLFLGKLTGKLIDLSQAAVLQSLVDGVPQGGNEALCAVKRALFHGNGVHRFHLLPDALVYRGEVQDSGLIIVVLWVVEETLADLQHHWGPRPLKVGCFPRLICVDRSDLPAQLRIASAGEHAAMILLVLFAQQLQQFDLKAAALLHSIQQGHGLVGEHLALIQKYPKLLKVGNLRCQTAGIGIVGQVDEVLQGDGTPATAPLHCQQSFHPRVFLRRQCGQPLGQQIQVI